MLFNDWFEKKYEFRITKWQMTGSIFNRDNFSRNFITCIFFFFYFLSIVLGTDQLFYNDYLDLCGFQVNWNTLN